MVPSCIPSSQPAVYSRTVIQVRCFSPGCRSSYLHMGSSYFPHWSQSVPQNVMFEYSDWCLKTSILGHLAPVRDNRTLSCALLPPPVFFYS